MFASGEPLPSDNGEPVITQGRRHAEIRAAHHHEIRDEQVAWAKKCDFYLAEYEKRYATKAA